MKHKMSIKLRLTLWFTGFMALMAAVCLLLILVIGSRVSEDRALSLLDLSVRSDIENIHYADGRLTLEPELSFYENDIYKLIYNKSGAVLGGQTPPGFDISEPLENGVTRVLHKGGESFLVFDLFIPSGWEDGVWLRGISEYPDIEDTLGRSMTIFLIILPFIIIAASVGGYFLIKRALLPIELVTKAAGSISEGRDLSRRINSSTVGDDEAGRLADAFDHMFERLERSFEAEKQFASDASHELRTPTAVIVAQCAYLDKYADELSDYKEGVEVIKRQAGRMSLLIDRLLDITRLDFGTKKLELSDTDVSELVGLICEEQDSGVRGRKLSADISPNIHKLVDPYLFSRVVNNLLDNARKYGREGGHIWVSLSYYDGASDIKQENASSPVRLPLVSHLQAESSIAKAEGDNASQKKAVLTVRDDGIGMTEDELSKIWQRFYQANPSRSEGTGSGLGLSMVKQIVELHGGSITAESTYGEGSTFTVIF